MKKLDFGFIQGRMTLPPSKNLLQYFPKRKWQEEFLHARKNKFKFIEYFGERNFNKRNPIWTKEGLKKINYLVKKNNLINYSFCEDYFINHNFVRYKKFEEYTDKIINNLSLINIKVYVLALFEKNEIKKKNFQTFVDKIKLISNKFEEKKIRVALETNLDFKSIIKLINLVNSKNLYIVYDTGNRLKKQNLQYKEIIKLKKFICHVHLKDKNWKGKNVDLGSGKVNFYKIFKALKRIKYDGKFTFETHRGIDPIVTMNDNKKKILQILKNLK